MPTMPRSVSCIALLGLTALLGSGLTAQRGELKAGRWTKADVPDGWLLHRTRYYQIQSQCGIDKAERLGEHMETMNAVYSRMFRSGKSGRKPSPIKLFADRKAYLAYGAPPGAAAYYSRTDGEMVCYDTGKWSDEPKVQGPVTGGDEEADKLQRRLANMEDMFKMDLLGVAAHEGWHQYFAWYVGSWVQLPSWINEGMGDYFYTASPRERRGRKIPAELGRMFPMRMAVMQSAARQGRHVPLADFIGYMQRDYYSNPSVCYSQGWALCQFLLHSDNKKYNQIIPTYLRLIRDDTNHETVTRRSFKGIDLDVLEQEFLTWVKEQKIDEDKDQADQAADGNG
jgi:hypothetical protein